MSTGPWHYKTAEEHADKAKKAWGHSTQKVTDFHTDMAHIHARLAQVAVTALGDMDRNTADPLVKEWAEAIGES